MESQTLGHNTAALQFHYVYCWLYPYHNVTSGIYTKVMRVRVVCFGCGGRVAVAACIPVTLTRPRRPLGGCAGSAYRPRRRRGAPPRQEILSYTMQ
jgi:hypothetical protein